MVGCLRASSIFNEVYYSIKRAAYTTWTNIGLVIIVVIQCNIINFDYEYNSKNYSTNLNR